MADDVSTIQKFEIAWKWFDLHAKQRQTNIQFGITLLAALIAAIGYCMHSKIYMASSLLSAFGVLNCFIFFGIDRRNSNLVKISEKIIDDICDKINRDGDNSINIKFFYEDKNMSLFEIKYSLAARLLFGSAAFVFFIMFIYSFFWLLF